MNNIQFNFTGSRFVVTGASSGIGREIASALAGAGAEVLAVARRRERLDELQRAFPALIRPAALDVTDFPALAAAVAEFAATGPLNGSVHAAGCNRFTPLRAFDWTAADRILGTSLRAGIELLRLVTAKSVAAPAGAHIQVASVAALCGQGGFAAYSAAKGGMIAATRALAMELAGRGIRINTLSPGWIKSEMTTPLESAYPDGIQTVAANHPLGLGTTADAASLALFLLSAEARWITGANFVMDGGFSSR